MAPPTEPVREFFLLPELLETLFLLLPAQDILRLQRVCKQFRATTIGSLKLQQHLFLRPLKGETAWLVDITNLPAGKGPLSYKHETPLYVKAAVSRTSREFKSHHGMVITPARHNPLFSYSKPPSDHEDLDSKAAKPPYIVLEMHYDRLQWLRQKHHVAMEMFLTNPPVRKVSVDAMLEEPPVKHGEQSVQEMREKPLVKRSDRTRHSRQRRLRAYQEIPVASKKHASFEVSELGGVTLGHIVHALGKLKDRGRVGSMKIYPSGVMIVDMEDEELVRAETEKRQAGVVREGEVVEASSA
ncbi:uncharacterized protein LTR77_002742 [Saxophila tyrrhenica]|uniref:F-box domain-containing protein n=1 Tax=Saxophila tyrrhenica TaxID=1690608 RepID=A0AAV9PIM3_9PEZI|nr:hypothetical protein LTR77_002742 [Saxophila tyrrhenica]